MAKQSVPIDRPLAGTGRGLYMRHLAAVGTWSLVLGAICFAQDFRVGVSVSPFTEFVLASGTTFTDGTVQAATTIDLERLFVKHGATEVYARINTTQTYRGGTGDHSVDRGLDRARLAASLHLPLNPELGLFGTYGDIRCQPPPDFRDYPASRPSGPWTALRLDEMLPLLRAYGAAVAHQILATGVSVNVWDLGNEVEFGVAGVAVRPMPGGCDEASASTPYQPPDDVDPAIGRMSVGTLAQMPEGRRIAWLSAHLWPHEARLLGAVAAGIRSVDPSARFSTHMSGLAATAPTFAVAFFEAMAKGGFTVDECGMSYYPTSTSAPSDRLDAFKRMAEAVKRQTGHPVFVAEFGYPAAPMQGLFSWNAVVAGYPESTQGQAAFVHDLVSWGVREGLLAGIRPWAPDLVRPGWAPMALFDRQGPVMTARPALDAFAPSR